MGYGSCGHRSSDFYPRPPRGGRPLGVLVDDRVQHISIHALREEGDMVRFQAPGGVEISIHALREEGDETRGAPSGPGRHFYPRPPRGGRLDCGHVGHNAVHISIHALREEGDRTFSARAGSAEKFLSTPSARRATPSRHGPPYQQGFLSTPSARRATYGHAAAARHLDISIHALREEGDRRLAGLPCPKKYFYPRPPRGGRLGTSNQ